MPSSSPLRSTWQNSCQGSCPWLPHSWRSIPTTCTLLQMLLWKVRGIAVTYSLLHVPAPPTRRTCTRVAAFVLPTWQSHRLSAPHPHILFPCADDEEYDGYDEDEDGGAMDDEVRRCDALLRDVPRSL